LLQKDDTNQEEIREMTAEQNKGAATEGKNTPFLPKGMDKSVSYRAVRGQFNDPTGTPVVLISQPGQGKTAVVYALAAEHDYEVITIVGSQKDRTDITGLPTLVNFTVTRPDGTVDEVRQVEYAVEKWQRIVMERKRVVVFLDELNTAPPDVVSSLLTILADRRFPNGETMPEETVILGAMNDRDTGSEYHDMAPALANRLCLVGYHMPLGAWLDGVRRAWGKTVGEREQWMRRAVADFVDENPGYANMPNDPMGEAVNAAQFGFASDPANDMVAAHAFPSYRSWDRLATKLAHTSPLEDGSPDTELEHVYAGGMIGFKAAFAFREFLTRRREAEKTFDARQFINDAFTIGDDGEPVANPDALSEWPRIVGEDGADNRLAVAREAGRLAVDDVEETHVTAEELRNIMLLLPVLSGDEEVPGVGGRLDSSALASLGKSVSKVFTKAQKHAYEVTAGDAEGRVKRRMVVNALAKALACPHISDAKNMKAASRAA
jgi:hypothetical protein